MKKYTQYIVFAIVCLQFVGFFAPIHTHADEFLVGNSHEIQQIVQHGDADHCKHLPLSHEKDCILCSISLQQSFKHSPFVFTIEYKESETVIDSQHSNIPNFLVSHSISHRGPPVLFV
jgi:hypothetical protein